MKTYVPHSKKLKHEMYQELNAKIAFYNYRHLEAIRNNMPKSIVQAWAIALADLRVERKIWVREVLDER